MYLLQMWYICDKCEVWFSHQNKKIENMSPSCGCIWIYRAYLCTICDIYENMKQIIVTNVRSGSLTKGSHPPQPDPLDRPCPLTSPHLLPPATLHVLSYSDHCDFGLWLWPSVLIFTSHLIYLPHCIATICYVARFTHWRLRIVIIADYDCGLLS